MSYERPDTGNTMNDYFTALSDFAARLPALDAAPDAEAFGKAVAGLKEIDPRSILIQLRTRWSALPEDRRLAARSALGESLSARLDRALADAGGEASG